MSKTDDFDFFQGLNDDPGERSQVVVDNAAPVVAPASKPKPVTVAPTLERVIDLGDGSGVQRFTGTSEQELIDKLVEAQTNATRKIREQAQLLKEPVREVEQVAPPQAPDWGPYIPTSPEEEQALNSLSAMFEATSGYSPQELGEMMQQMRSQQEFSSVTSAIDDFKSVHPDYYATEENGNLMIRFLDRNGLYPTPPNLDYAYTRLNINGLLKSKPDTGSDEEAQAPSRPVVRTGALSGRGSAEQPGSSMSKDRTIELAQDMTAAELKQWLEESNYAKRHLGQ